MPSLSAFPSMMRCDRKRERLRVCHAARLIGFTVREYREIEAGERDPDFETWREPQARCRHTAANQSDSSWSHR